MNQKFKLIFIKYRVKNSPKIKTNKLYNKPLGNRYSAFVHVGVQLQHGNHHKPVARQPRTRPVSPQVLPRHVAGRRQGAGGGGLGYGRGKP